MDIDQRLRNLMTEVGCCGTDCVETWKLVRAVLAIGEELGYSIGYDFGYCDGYDEGASK